ncbi:MAG: hypothetical protein GY730_02545, partial [bacterium]|nr:hypothetical protein [bacterium]
TSAIIESISSPSAASEPKVVLKAEDIAFKVRKKVSDQNTETKQKNILLLKAEHVFKVTDKQLSAHHIDSVSKNNKDSVEEIREVYKQAVEKEGIVGFDSEIDRMFDPTSHYLCIKKQEAKITGAVRIIFKTQNNQLPIEYGTIVNSCSAHHKITLANSVELSTFLANDIFF